MVILVIMLLLGIPCIVCSIFAFLKKGPIMSTTFLVANKAQREKMRNKRNYLFTGTVFCLLGVCFVLLGVSAYVRNSWFMYVAAAMAVITIVVVIAGSIKSEC